jgi:hypothetical protein
VFEDRASNYEAHNLAKHVLSESVGHHIWLATTYSDSELIKRGRLSKKSATDLKIKMLTHFFNSLKPSVFFKKNYGIGSLHYFKQCVSPFF